MRYLKVFASAAMYTTSLILIVAAVFSATAEIAVLSLVAEGKISSWFLLFPVPTAIFFGGLSGVVFCVANEVRW